MQMFLECHDDAPADRISFTKGRVGAVLKRTNLCAGLIKIKEELLGPATTDDEEDDKIGDFVDTLRYFTEKFSEETYLDQSFRGKDTESNEKVRATCRQSTRWKISQTQQPPRTHTAAKNSEILKQTTGLQKLTIIELLTRHTTPRPD